MSKLCIVKIGAEKQYESYTLEEATFNVYKQKINSTSGYYYILENTNDTISN